MMRNVLKKIPWLRQLYQTLKNSRITKAIDTDSLKQQLQRILINQHQLFARNCQKTHEDISDAAFRCYSEFEEDGSILYVLAMIGMETKKVVEIGCGNGTECMATNLILHHGYTGYLLDGNENNSQSAKLFFRYKKDCFLAPPELRSAWITKDNI